MLRPILFAVAALVLNALPANAQSPTADPMTGLQPGEAFVTRFSGTSADRAFLDLEGVVGAIIDLRRPGQPALGQHWLNEPQRNHVRARETGQIFGVALDDASPPNIFVTATAAFGLHRTPDNRDWMPGQWGPGGGPATIYRLSAAEGYRPQVFANVTLDGRANTGAALGNIAYDRFHRQLLVSDMETGMIHRISVDDGRDLGRFDHGVQARGQFYDSPSGQSQSLNPVGFDTASGARIADCPHGAFARTPSCWNVADFRRRVWGLNVRQDPATGEIRLYYAVWSSQGLGNPAFAAAGEDEKRNSLWSVALTEVGDFDPTRITREFILPDFHTRPGDISELGFSNPVSDITFQQCGEQRTMLLAERGGLRNRGLSSTAPFANPFQSRVLRYKSEDDDTWSLEGRYDVGFHDRRGMREPRIRAGSAGGVSFGYGYGPKGIVSPGATDKFVWMSGDALCSPSGPCFNPNAGQRNDGSHVHGFQGTPEGAIVELFPEIIQVAVGADPYPPTGPRQSFMIDADINIDGANQPIPEELSRDDSTKIGDIAIYQSCAVTETEVVPPAGEVVVTEAPPVDEPPPTVDTPPVLPDLEKQKTGPAQCIAGGVCTFTITVSNNGPGTWSGPLIERDTLPPGSVLAAYAPQPDWACAQAGDIVNCEHVSTTLVPGDFVTLTVDVILPIDTVGVVENCIEDVWAPWGPDDSPDTILAVEQRLAALGYDPGVVDGVFDAATDAAIRDYQTAMGLPVDGVITDTLRATMFPEDAGLTGDANPLNDRACHEVEVLPPPPPPPPAPPPPVPPVPPTTTGTPEPPRTGNCDDTISQGSDNPETIDIDLGGRQGPGRFEWENYSIKDQMRVYVDGALVHDTGCTGGNGVQAIDVPPGAQSARVEVIPNCAGTTGTAWNFKLICPPPQQTKMQTPIVQIASVPPMPPEVVIPEEIYITPPPTHCPPGTWRRGDDCISIIEVIDVIVRPCPPHLVRRHGYCVCPNGRLPHHGRCEDRIGWTCPPPFVMHHGRCVCPPGTQPHHGRCERVQTCRPPLVPSHGTCVCPNGQRPHHGRCEPIIHCKPPTVERGGRCVCPNGAVPHHGRCDKPTTCVPPMVRQGDRCGCPAGTQLQHGRCVTTTCKPPMVMRHGKCVMAETQKCPAGTVFRNGRCVTTTITCPAGQTLRHGRCVVTTGPQACPAGQVMRHGRCVTVGPVKCPTGFTLRHGQCVRDPAATCPPGTVRKGTVCAPIATKTPQHCPPGTQRIGTGCVPTGKTPTTTGPATVKPPVLCPPGTNLVGRSCVPTVKTPTTTPSTVRTPPACPPGTHRVGAACVPLSKPPTVKPPTTVKPPVACPPGTHRVGASCVPLAKPPTVTPPTVRPPVACPPGTHRVGAACVPLAKPPTVTPPTVKPPAHCPPGTHRLGNACVPDAKPPVVKPPVVKPPVIPACPPGTVRKGGSCVSIAKPPVVKPPPPKPPVVKPPPPKPKPPVVKPPPPKPKPPVVRPPPPKPKPVVRPPPPKPKPVVRPPPPKPAPKACPPGTVRVGGGCVPIKRK